MKGNFHARFLGGVGGLTACAYPAHHSHAMKKIVIAGCVVVLLFIAILLAWQRSKPPSDAEIRQKIAGTWTPVSSSGHPFAATTEMSPDGGFISRWKMATNEITIEGNWNVQDGFVALTMTNVVGADPHSLGAPVQRFKIVQIGNRQMVSYIGSPTNLTTMERR